MNFNKEKFKEVLHYIICKCGFKLNSVWFQNILDTYSFHCRAISLRPLFLSEGGLFL